MFLSIIASSVIIRLLSVVNDFGKNVFCGEMDNMSDCLSLSKLIVAYEAVLVNPAALLHT